MSDGVTPMEVVFRTLARAVEPAVVDSPPGAGKTTLVADVAAYRALELGQRVLIATKTHSAADEVCRKLLAVEPAPPIFRVVKAAHPLPDRRLLRADTLPHAEFGAPHVAVTTLAKLAYVAAEAQGAYDVCLVDEAYLTLWHDLAPALLVGRQPVLIGDPGQLPPVVRAPVREWEGLPGAPHLPAPLVFRDAYAERGALPRHLRLPRTYRLRPDTAALVQRHFYPHHPFRAAPGAAARRLETGPGPGGSGRFDPLIDLVAQAGASVVLGVLPAGAYGELDPEAAVALAELAARLLARTPHGPGEIAILVSHRQQGAATRACLVERLGELGRTIWCDTVDRAQGREWPIVLGLHPLSGVRRPGEFALAPGRLCVLLSRATVATFLLCREGVGPALRGFDARDGDEFDAARTHRALLHELWTAGRVLRCD